MVLAIPNSARGEIVTEKLGEHGILLWEIPRLATEHGGFPHSYNFRRGCSRVDRVGESARLAGLCQKWVGMITFASPETFMATFPL
jgi:hypothetical protein